MKKKKKKLWFKSSWSSEDKQSFSDRNILKAKTIPNKKKTPPNKSEWNYDDN